MYRNDIEEISAAQKAALDAMGVAFAVAFSISLWPVVGISFWLRAMNPRL